MSCRNEHLKRQTYENQKRYANFAYQIQGKIQVVYRTDKGFYRFCSKEEFTPQTGVFIEYVGV